MNKKINFVIAFWITTCLMQSAQASDTPYAWLPSTPTTITSLMNSLQNINFADYKPSWMPNSLPTFSMPDIDVSSYFNPSQWQIPSFPQFNLEDIKLSNPFKNISSDTSNKIVYGAIATTALGTGIYGIRSWQNLTQQLHQAHEREEALNKEKIEADKKQMAQNLSAQQNENQLLKDQLTNQFFTQLLANQRLRNSSQELNESEERGSMAHEEMLSRLLFNQKLRTDIENQRTEIDHQKNISNSIMNNNSELRDQLKESEERGSMAHEELLQRQETRSVDSKKWNDFITSIDDVVINPFKNYFDTTNNEGALYEEAPDQYNIKLDTIIQPTLIQEISENSIYNLENTTGSTSKSSGSTIKQMTLTPNYSELNIDMPSQQPILIKVVHGTWGRGNAFGADEGRYLSQCLYIFAKQLALASKATVVFDVFQWNGKLDKTSRDGAAGILANEIVNAKRDNPNMIIWTIGHSHGCNVINTAAQYLKSNNITIDNAVYLASPILDINPLESENKRYNIRSLLNIFGQADFTGKLGALFQTLSSSNLTNSLTKDQAIAENEIVRNITLKREGQDLDHKTIKIAAAQFLAGIIQYIHQFFLLSTDITLNIYDSTAHIDHQSCSSSSASAGIEIRRSRYQVDSPKEQAITSEQALGQDGLYSACMVDSHDTKTPWIIEGVINPTDPFIGHRAQQVVSSKGQALIQSSLALSNVNEAKFQTRYGRSIHQKTSMSENLFNEILSQFGVVQGLQSYWNNFSRMLFGPSSDSISPV